MKTTTKPPTTSPVTKMAPVSTPLNSLTSFTTLQSAVAKQFKAMSAHRLFSTTTYGDKLWELYLASFPAGSNPMYKIRTEHDCSCCRHFIRNIGGVVNIVGGKIITLWDFEIGGPFQAVVNALAEYVRGQMIDSVYLHYERSIGTAKSNQLLEDKATIKTWDHFHVNLPDAAVVKKDQIGPKTGEFRATHDVMLRGLDTITPEAVDTTMELIAQNSLYRGEEQKFALTEFQTLQSRFISTYFMENKDLLVWEYMETVPESVSRIRNTAIGTLLTDLSSGMELEDAVKAFESKVAPTNYKRPTALVTKAMVAKAQAKVDELGLTTALDRRYATLSDITVNNIIFADRATKKAMNVFDAIGAAVVIDPKKLGKVEDIGIGEFITNVLPTAKSVEVLFENQHSGNMVSLVAPVDPTARRLFKWDNGFSWSYVGDLADSIKERVKKAGGNVTGDFRASLAWFNTDDLDLHLRLPNGVDIGFQNRRDLTTGGNLDVDMNISGDTRSAVENITFPTRSRMMEGVYALIVNQYNRRESIDVGFEIEMEFDGVVYNFARQEAVVSKQNVIVCQFSYSHKEGLKIVESLPVQQTVKTVWGLTTQAFHKVRVIMLSPNQWDGREVGNKHWFFMLDGCLNDGTARGFFNEFLGVELTPHRKVLEMVGARMKTDTSESQLSGLGFSSTQRNHLLCWVTGSFTRVVKVLF